MPSKAITNSYKDFKKRTDTYDANLGLVYAENDPDHKGDHLDQELLICDLDGRRRARRFQQIRHERGDALRTPPVANAF